MGGREEGREEGVSWCVSVHVCVHVRIIQSVDLSEIPKVSNQFVPCASPLGSTSWNVSDFQIVRDTWVSVAKDKSNHPVADSLRSVLRRAGVEQLYQVKRMIGGIGNMLFSIYSQTENV